MQQVLILGAGKIGSLIALLLLKSEDYDVTVADLNFSGHDCSRLGPHPHLHLETLDVQDDKAMSVLLEKKTFNAVISSLPFFCNLAVAKLAKKYHINYFDLTEDTTVTDVIKELAEDSDCAFVPQCGLAPGYIGIIGHSLIEDFDVVDTVAMRVGALPINSNNTLQYSLTWSTDGLINEYSNPCYAIKDGKRVLLRPLEGLENIQVDGMKYEAFNTSGGLGSLVEIHEDKISSMNYKTIRYPGHNDKIKFLMNDLKLGENRGVLKEILENAIPKTYRDVVIIYVSVTGQQSGQLLEENYVNKIYPQNIDGYDWSAIQLTTAASICAVVDLVLTADEPYQGFVYQETFPLDLFLDNRFGALIEQSE